MTFGYIYIRNHESYYKYNAFKIGKTNNIPERDSVYATSEIKKGYFYAYKLSAVFFACSYGIYDTDILE